MRGKIREDQRRVEIQNDFQQSHFFPQIVVLFCTFLNDPKYCETARRPAVALQFFFLLQPFGFP